MGDERVKAEALQILGLFQVLPRLVVFDLDYTLWPFYCECRSKRDSPSLFRHARGIMYALKEKGIDMAIASRSPTPDIAKVFLDKLELQSMFVAQEIFSSWTHKTEHFQKIQRKTGIPYKSMLFFDDEDRNIDPSPLSKKPKSSIKLPEKSDRRWVSDQTVESSSLSQSSCANKVRFMNKSASSLVA